MSLVTFREAVTTALADAMAADDSVFVLGEDVAAAGGVFKLTDGLLERFGADRVLDTPISEQAIVGTAIGAAVQGLRPVAEIMFADFAAVCFDQIANQMAKYRYMTGGQVTVPATLRLINGAGNGFGAQHSQAVENWFLNVPGLKLVAPATPGDAYALLRAAITDPDPVLFFEHKALFNVKGPIPDDPASTAIGVADVVHAGSDVTVVATQLMRHRAEAALESLTATGIDTELIDLRTLAPMDIATVAESVAKTKRLVVVQEGSRTGGWGGSLVAELTEQHLEVFDAPPRVVACDDAPLGYAAPFEEAYLPSAARIAEAVEAVVAY